MKLKFHTDPGHGWLAVKRKLLEDWGMLDEISPYSYENGKTVYLEEDLDAGIFLKEAKDKGIEVQLEESYRDNTPIRNYPSFSA